MSTVTAVVGADMENFNIIKYAVETTVFRDIIEHKLISQDLQGNATVISRKVINVEEENTKKALMALGWTPPNTTKQPTAWMHEDVNVWIIHDEVKRLSLAATKRGVTKKYTIPLYKF